MKQFILPNVCRPVKLLSNFKSCVMWMGLLNLSLKKICTLTGKSPQPLFDKWKGLLLKKKKPLSLKKSWFKTIKESIL